MTQPATAPTATLLRLAGAGARAKSADEAERERQALLDEAHRACDTLRDAGVFARTEAAERAEADRRAAEALDAKVRLIAAQGIALKHARVLAGAAPERTPVPFPTRVARRWGRSAELLLVLAGPKGCGKSFGAAEQVHLRGGRMIAARILLRHGWWCSSSSKGRDRDGDGRSAVTRLTHEEMLTTPILGIDDLGQEADKDHALVVEAVDTLVCLRCDAGLRTLITTNFLRATDTDRLAGTLEGYLGTRRETLLARVVEYGAIVECPAQDLRAEERQLKIEAATARRGGGAGE